MNYKGPEEKMEDLFLHHVSGSSGHPGLRTVANMLQTMNLTPSKDALIVDVQSNFGLTSKYIQHNLQQIENQNCHYLLHRVYMTGPDLSKISNSITGAMNRTANTDKCTIVYNSDL